MPFGAGINLQLLLGYGIVPLSPAAALPQASVAERHVRASACNRSI
jgi:hypothetical protein